MYVIHFIGTARGLNMNVLLKITQLAVVPAAGWGSKHTADLVAQHDQAPATAWLETETYRTWWPSDPIPRSSFLPVQGPLVSDNAALKHTIEAFIQWLERVLGGMGWSTLSYINEHVLELTREEKNLRRAEKAEIGREIEDGISERSLAGFSTSFDPWLDFENWEHWVAHKDSKATLLSLASVEGSYIIKNTTQFPDAPKGTTERLIYTVLRDLREQYSREGGYAKRGDLLVTFDISVAGDFEPTKNISGWKFTWLNKTYTSVSHGTNLLQRHEFRVGI
ncbi:hypothetical protein BDN67DRAFT_996059 [Paxillus ammoniavirescens]|nr:hypothetical protein BDN67DRAFT_996059 [Paxillus ammoniavirescens]